ncbi:hypothetical protein QBC43DRAFT_250903 [Cladorrhinum sp. PSN259]|nr:hypothetical protein QBC43DRAFT_250903 [Cladorrhinum sp. PSN259]
MFITLKSGMEQVAKRQAGPDGPRERLRVIRRPACFACQAKKLRCTGDSGSCDRCQAKSINCTFPSKTIHSRTRGAPPLQQQINTPGLVSESLPNVIGEHEASLSQTKTNFPNNEKFDFSNPILPGAQVSTTPSEQNPIPTPSSTVLPPENSTTPAFQTPLLQNEPPTEPLAACTCLPDLLNVLKQLDDDTFHLSTLALDQVIQLQKWIVFQCWKPLDCPGCLFSSSSSYNLTLIICDRLIQMFECIKARINAAKEIMGLAGLATAENASTSTTTVAFEYRQVDQDEENEEEEDVGSGQQLFCSLTGKPGRATKCNPLMFSDEFRNLYSHEEQVHMVHALLGLQLRNLGRLLEKIGGMVEGGGNLARQGRVRGMQERLGQAGGEIEAALKEVLAGLVGIMARGR